MVLVFVADTDGDLDALIYEGNCGTPSGSAHYIHENLGYDNFKRIQPSWVAPCLGTADAKWTLADYNNDGLVDILATSGWVCRNNGDATFSRDAVAEASSIAGALREWADVDGDGDLDVFVGAQASIHPAQCGERNHATNWINCLSQGYELAGGSRILYNDGHGVFTEINATNHEFRTYANAMKSPQKAAWGDFDGDGHPDLFIAFHTHNDGELDELHRNNGDGTFTWIRNSTLSIPKPAPIMGQPHQTHRVIWGDCPGLTHVAPLATARLCTLLTVACARCV